MNSNNKKKNPSGITGVEYKFEAMVPGLDKNNIFVYGQAGQADRYIKSRKGLIEWVGTTKEYKNVMYAYLTKKEEPTFIEPTEPTGDNVTTAQLEKYKMKLRKQMDEEEEWLEAKG